MLTSLQQIYCRPGISQLKKSEVGLIAVIDIPSHTKVLNKPCYHGHWCYTKELQEKKCENRIINELQYLFRNKKLFMQNENRTYTFVPDIPLYEFHGEMFLNNAKAGNVVLQKNGYFTCKDVKAGEELLVIM